MAALSPCGIEASPSVLATAEALCVDDVGFVQIDTKIL